MARDFVTEARATERDPKRGNSARRAGRAVGSGKMRARSWRRGRGVRAGGGIDPRRIARSAVRGSDRLSARLSAFAKAVATGRVVVPMPSARPRFPWRGAFVVLGAWLAVGLAPEAAGAAARRFGVTEEGAVADGQTLNTVAIQTAIDRAESSGRGVVEIPAGTLLSGSIFLKRGVELWLAEGAVRLGSTNIEDDPKRETRSEGHFEPGRMALVNAPGLTRVRIGGKGPINGNGVPSWQAFWARRKEKPKCTHLEVERPRLLFVDNGREGRIEGLALQDAGFWTLPIDHCRDALIEGWRITLPSAVNGLRGPSTDGIDGDSCQNVTIRRCAMATQDGTIALKGSKGPLADQDGPSPPVENITVEDCEYGDGNGLITCGSEATLVRNVSVRHCTLSGRATLLTLKLRRTLRNATSGSRLTGSRSRAAEAAGGC